MAFIIDRETFQKRNKPMNHGYNMRQAGQLPTSIIVHSTSGNPGSSFSGEARFLVDSLDVSAHYLVGKQGQIAEILPPGEFRAWHSGEALPEFTNSRSIGIECHHAKGDSWPDEQIAALTWLVQRLMARYGIPTELITTHRAAALPAGRKKDPDDWNDADFVIWQDTLAAVDVGTMIVALNGVRIRKEPNTLSEIIGKLNANALVDVETIVNGETILGEPRWARLADDRGFMTMKFLRQIA